MKPPKTLISTLFGLPEPEPERPKPKARRKQYGNAPRRVFTSTDINAWWASNRPETLTECDDLRQSLKDYRKVKSYNAKVDESGWSDRREVRLDGPNGSVRIVSRKARFFLNAKIDKVEKDLRMYADQFGYEVKWER